MDTHLRIPMRLRALVLFALTCAACSDAPADPDPPTPPTEAPAIALRDVTLDAGIDFMHNNGRESGAAFYVETIMAGVAFFDADRDGDPDLYFLNGKPLAGEMPDPLPTNRFYLNDGTGHFEDATEASGLGDSRYACGVCAADYDNDGDIDLYVTNFDVPNALYQNDGNGHFVDVAEEAGVLGVPDMPSSSAFADLDNDGWLDLYVGNCVDHSLSNNIRCKGRAGLDRRLPIYCGPQAYNPLVDTLYRNRGDGTFEDITESSGIALASANTLGVAISDYDDDGDQDIFVASDRSPNLLYENLGDMQFQEVGMRSGAALSSNGAVQAGMGIVTGDYDGDQRFDIGVTYYAREWNSLYRNSGNLLFEDRANQARTLASSLKPLGWGTELFDVDLDGDLDWMIVNGHTQPQAKNISAGQELHGVESYPQTNLFFENLGGGVFKSLGVQAGPALETARVSRGFAVADIDGDGDLDAIVANLHGRPELLRNDSARGDRHWLTVRTVGTVSNRDGVGARILVETPGQTQIKEVRTGQSYLSQSELPVHFGLDTADVVSRLEVRWPSGATSVLQDVPADQVIAVIEPDEAISDHSDG